MPTIEFWIKKNNIQQHEFRSVDTPQVTQDNDVLLEITSVAFTANNTTYAHSGEALRYWDFFPTGDKAWGKLPVWGFATVIESNSDEITAGEQIYGFFPLASHLLIQAGKISPSGFVDAAPHRNELSPIYNRYLRVANSTGFASDNLDLNALLRPMFTTSFLLDDFLLDNDFFEADLIISSSASSKTAYGMAFLLNKYRADRRAYQLVGLTSDHNVRFVESLNLYDTVLSYTAVPELDANATAVYVDFAGNGKTRRTLHEHFADNLRHNAIVGGTHWDQLGTAKGLPGAKPQFFFAPAQLQKRIGEWGREQYQERYDTAWTNFLIEARTWIEVENHAGQDAIANLYDEMLANRSNPQSGYILSF